jgi:hypothetical protein
MNARACNCIGPQNGQPRCPCMMRGLIQRDGYWVEPERRVGEVVPTYHWPQPGVGIPMRGCVCPIGAEITCKGAMCPRRGLTSAGSLS